MIKTFKDYCLLYRTIAVANKVYFNGVFAHEEDKVEFLKRVLDKRENVSSFKIIGNREICINTL